MNEQLKKLAIELFVGKEVNLSEPNVIAAIISAAQGMSLCSELVKPEEVVDALLDAFGVKGNSEVEKLIGMSSSFVKLNTGFSVIFEDASMAMINYQIQADKYNALFTAVRDKVLAAEDSVTR